MTSSPALPHETAPKQSSIVTHPWFPKMVGLWFAALFGLCSLALAPEMLERIVTTLGIDRIVPAAAPPLGQTARLLLALGMAGVGEIAGLLIGARLATRTRAEPARRRGVKPAAGDADDTPQLRDRDRHPDAPARKPLSATSDLGETAAGIDRGGIDNVLRRRALASEAEHEPRPFFEAAPLPGGDHRSSGAAQEEACVADEPQNQPEVAPVAEQPAPPEVFDLAQCFVPGEDAPETEAAPFTTPAAVGSESFVTAFMADKTAMPSLAGAEPADVAPPTIATASLDELGVVQLSERLALALLARRERRERQSAASSVVAPVAVGIEQAEIMEPVPERAIEEPSPVEPVAAVEEVVVPDAFKPAPFAAPPLFAPLLGDETEEESEIPALARSLSLPPLARPRPLEAEAAAEAMPDPRPEPTSPQLARGLEILARRAPRTSVEPDAPVQDRTLPEGSDDGEDAEDLSQEVLEEGYSSLLAMGLGSQRPEAVRVEEPRSDEIEPVVIFPGQAARGFGEVPGPSGASFNAPFARPANPPAIAEAAAAADPVAPTDPDETDRALRAALASLHRISGAR